MLILLLRFRLHRMLVFKCCCSLEPGCCSLTCVFCVCSCRWRCTAPSRPASSPEPGVVSTAWTSLTGSGSPSTPSTSGPSGSTCRSVRPQKFLLLFQFFFKRVYFFWCIFPSGGSGGGPAPLQEPGGVFPAASQTRRAAALLFYLSGNSLNILRSKPSDQSAIVMSPTRWVWLRFPQPTGGSSILVG